MLHSLQPSHGGVNFILAQLYVGVYRIGTREIFGKLSPISRHIFLACVVCAGIAFFRNRFDSLGQIGGALGLKTRRGSIVASASELGGLADWQNRGGCRPRRHRHPAQFQAGQRWCIDGSGKALEGDVAVPVEELSSAGERTALVGFLAGYSGLTRDAYALDLRMYTAWCSQHHVHLFQARRADIECFGRDIRGTSRLIGAGPRQTCF